MQHILNGHEARDPNPICDNEHSTTSGELAAQLYESALARAFEPTRYDGPGGVICVTVRCGRVTFAQMLSEAANRTAETLRRRRFELAGVPS